MIEMCATVKNANGIHCRPSAVIAKEVMNYPGDIAVITESGVCDPRSIMALISMGLQQGARVRVRVSGPHEAAWCRKLVALFEKNYDFPPRDANLPLPSFPLKKTQPSLRPVIGAPEDSSHPPEEMPV